jgi:hypothetical protein
MNCPNTQNQFELVIVRYTIVEWSWVQQGCRKNWQMTTSLKEERLEGIEWM